jgi:hypothetical protein
MADRSTSGPRARYRTWLTTLALAATFPLAIGTPAAAQEQPAVDPMEIMRQEFEACIARGEEGADCAALAKLTLEIIMAGGTVSTGGTAPDTSQDDASVSGTDQINSSGGEDGQRSSGGDESISGDPASEPTGEQAPPAETTGDPAPTGDTGDQAPPADGTTPPPAESTTQPDMTQPGSTTTTTTTTSEGTNTGSTSTLSGGTQSDSDSGTDGRRRPRD